MQTGLRIAYEMAIFFTSRRGSFVQLDTIMRKHSLGLTSIMQLAIRTPLTACTEDFDSRKTRPDASVVTWITIRHIGGTLADRANLTTSVLFAHPSVLRPGWATWIPSSALCEPLNPPTWSRLRQMVWTILWQRGWVPCPSVELDDLTATSQQVSIAAEYGLIDGCSYRSNRVRYNVWPIVGTKVRRGLAAPRWASLEDRTPL